MTNLDQNASRAYLCAQQPCVCLTIHSEKFRFLFGALTGDLGELF